MLEKDGDGRCPHRYMTDCLSMLSGPKWDDTQVAIAH